MKSQLYIKWIHYLKKRGFYGEFVYQAAKKIEMEYNWFASSNSTHPYFVSDGERLDKIVNIWDLINFMRELMFYRPRNPKNIMWTQIAEKFGREYGYLTPEKERIEPGGNLYWDLPGIEFRTATTYSRTEVREEPRGQWYDRFYRQNNNRRENRWRR